MLREDTEGLGGRKHSCKDASRCGNPTRNKAMLQRNQISHQVCWESSAPSALALGGGPALLWTAAADSRWAEGNQCTRCNALVKTAMLVAPALPRVCTTFPIPGKSRGGGAGAGCLLHLVEQPKPQCWPCSASSPGPGGVTPAAGWSCPSSARTVDSPVPTCRGLQPVTPKSSPHRWRGPSRTRDWCHSPPSLSPCTGGSQVGRRGLWPCSRDANGTQRGGFVSLHPGS